MKLQLEDGMDYGYDDKGNKICRGARMGRMSILPDNKEASVKLRMEKLKWSCGDYDQGGAYWGRSGYDSIYCAWLPNSNIKIFVRASNREQAKNLVIEDLPNATFFK
jgi:hypothetical protein